MLWPFTTSVTQHSLFAIFLIKIEIQDLSRGFEPTSVFPTCKESPCISQAH